MPIIYPSVPVNIKPTPAQQQIIGSPHPSLIYGMPTNPIWYLVGAGLVLFLLLKD